MRPRDLWTTVLFVGSLAACKGNDDLAERERQLAERERDIAQKELATLKNQVAAAPASATPPPPTEPASELPTSAAAAPKPPAPRPIVIAISLTVATRKADGKPWDALGNGPDPVITVTAGGKTFSAGPFQDQASASATFEAVTLAPGDSITVKVVDKDLQQNDLIGVFTTEFRGARTVQGTLEGGTISVSFQ